MTFNTNKNNIKPVLRGVAGVMVFFCLFAAGALQRIRAGQFACLDSVCYDALGFPAWITSLRCLAVFTLPIAFVASFTFFSLTVTLAGRSGFFTLVIALYRNFALLSLSVFSHIVTMIFSFLISGHGFFLSKRLILKPTVGLSYYRLC